MTYMLMQLSMTKMLLYHHDIPGEYRDSNNIHCAASIECLIVEVHFLLSYLENTMYGFSVCS